VRNAAAVSYTPAFLNVFAQEFRATSTNPDQRLQWTFGLFYNKSRQTGFQWVVSPYFPTQALEGLGKTIAEAFGQPQLPVISRSTSGSRSVTSSWPPTDRSPISSSRTSVLVAGARVARETAKYGIYINGPLNGPTATQFSGTERQTVVDPSTALTSSWTRTIFSTSAPQKGDRIGGVNRPSTTSRPCNEALAALGYSNGAPGTYKRLALELRGRV